MNKTEQYKNKQGLYDEILMPTTNKDIKKWFDRPIRTNPGGFYEYSYFILVPIMVVIGLYSAWLFYFADCGLVKQFWYLTYVPGRCL